MVKLVVGLMGLAEQAEAKVQVKAGRETSLSTSSSSSPSTSTLASTLAYTSTSTSTFLSFVPDRPGHDFRYALDNAKIQSELGWRPETNFDDGLRRTVNWYRENSNWWRPLKERLSRESKGFWTGT